MTGSVPGFVDVILNFGSTKYEGDNILAQMSRAGRRVVFLGDDTWIKLFSDHFTRYEGTTSFFVTDYTEVKGLCITSDKWNLAFIMLVLYINSLTPRFYPKIHKEMSQSHLHKLMVLINTGRMSIIPFK